ncbi:MAG: phosphodiester glycosidase family protein, partial [Candidatus Sericytochromatia bacterium]
AGTARIRIEKAYASPHKVFWLKDPHRLVIDLLKIFQQEKQSTVAPGIQLTRSYQGFPFGPVTYFFVKIEPQANVHLEPALAGSGRGFSKETVSRLSQRHGALLAINAGYFNSAGVPLGTLMQDRELIASPIYGRTLLGITRQGQLFISPNDKSLSAFFPQLNRTSAFHGVNFPRQNNQMVLYTPRYGQSTGTAESADAIELQVLIDGTVERIGDHDMTIPEDGYVISAQGQAAQWLKEQAYEGMQVQVFSRIWEQWAQIRHLIGGGPQLLKNGQIHITATEERFQPDIAQGRAPRTAFGLGANGELFLLVADGRQSHSRGLTLNELAQILKERGAVEALNFDGGGSSTLVIRDRVLNSPSDGHERPVADALLVIKD